MTSGERAALAAARALAHADRAAAVVPAIAPHVDAALGDAGASRAFTGIAFDLLCRALLSSRGHGSDVRGEVAALCTRSEARLGAEPWSDLYRACLLHLGGDAAGAAARYHHAARETEVLWPNSIGARSVIAPAERDAWLSRPCPEPAPILIERDRRAKAEVLMVACDHRYLRAYAPAWLRSVAAHGAEFGVHAHLVNPAPDDMDWVVEVAGATASRLSISTERHSGPEPRTWYAMARFVRLAELLDHYARPILVTDIDAAFTRPPELPDADIGFRIKHWGFHAHPWQSIQAGAVTVSPGAGGRKAAAMLRRLSLGSYAARAGRGIWFADQNMLSVAHRLLVADPSSTVADLSIAGFGEMIAFGRSL